MAAGGDSIQKDEQNLEFLVVCDDYPVFKTMASSIQRLQGRLNCAPSAMSARDYIARRKIDGIIVDMSVEGTVELLEGLRRGTSNKFSVVFAYVQTTKEAGSALHAGANFIVHGPMTEEKMFHTLRTAAPMMAAERKRYFRHPLTAPVVLKVDGKEAKATISNLSEGGMAVWCLSGCPSGSAVQFAFELPFGGSIEGKGEVAWVSSEGLIGIQFHVLQGNAQACLSEWLDRRDIDTATP
ncbi:MAG TPA: PilZ domain-containing protein [Verrucomicrobiae bacterium]|jgi:DNA-binding NarL/FixJ family response regulator|nr:PilZ domain-containing protein [Verrucomicrobiae bacterium]